MNRLTTKQLALHDVLHDADSAFGWAEISCLSSSKELEVPYAHKVDLEEGFVGITNNASNACHKKIDLPILSGYLSRRFHYRGNA